MEHQKYAEVLARGFCGAHKDNAVAQMSSSAKETTLVVYMPALNIRVSLLIDNDVPAFQVDPNRKGSALPSGR